MEPLVWIAIASGAVILILVIWAVVALSGGDKGPFEVSLLKGETVPTHNERGDWRVRLDTQIRNLGSRPVRIERVAFEARSAAGERMETKQVCGDRTRALQARAHPPDIIMRLPIVLRPRAHTDFTFDLFFGSKLRNFWPDGRIRMAAGAHHAADVTIEFPAPVPDE